MTLGVGRNALVSTRNLLFSMLLASCASDDAEPFVAAELDCNAQPGALLCTTFDEPGHDVTPFGFGSFLGGGITVPDAHGLALQFGDLGGTASAGGPAPQVDLVIQFDMKPAVAVNGRVGEIVIAPITLLQFDLIATPAGKSLRLYAQTDVPPEPPVMETLTPTMPLLIGDWNRIDLRLLFSAGQLHIEYWAGPRDIAPTPVQTTLSARPTPRTSWSFQLEYQRQTAMPDMILVDNVLLSSLP